VPVFHIEEKIVLRSWDDILNRPGYQSPAAPRKSGFLRIAAVYSFKEQSDVIKGRVKELKQTPKRANWLYLVSTEFRKTYPTDLLAALKELATNNNDNAILAAVAENEADASQLERLKSIPLSEVSAQFMQSVRWKGDSVITKRK